MTKRNNHSRDTLKEMAVDAAEKMIDAQGLKGLSARKVATEIGCAVGTLYLMFKNIDALMMAVNVRTLEQLEAQMPDLSDNPVQNIKDMAQSYIHYAITSSPRWLAVFEHHGSSEDVLSDEYQSAVTRLLIGLEKPLAMIHPSFDEEAIKVEARALWASVHGLCTLTVGHRLNRVRKIDPEAVIEVVLRRFLVQNGEKP